MNSSRSFALVFQPNVPAELLQLFEGYVDEHRGLKIVFCQAPSFDSYFVSVRICKLDGGKFWEVQIPSHFALAITDASEDRPSIGFVANNQ